ncbi:MAG TPA: polysaccharide deacetylase family protein [Victivallales bacterium]|nr:polysaccharide deacetylase family protein [Victivallales bacterium]
MKKLLFCIFLLVIIVIFVNSEEKGRIGQSEVTKWKDDANGCFLLMFDDSWPSHVQVAVPELEKRQLTATFYINPAKGEYKKMKDFWEGEKAAWKKGVIYGNHTMTHDGIQGMEDAIWEIEECNKVIINTIPGKKNRLISWGKPGVKDWKISEEDTQKILKKNYLIERPPFRDHGIVYHLKNTDEILALADKAIKNNSMEYVIAHGVERYPEINWGYQDFWPWKLQSFIDVLDGLVLRREKNKLWITDHISYYKYVTERDKAKINIIDTSNKQIEIKILLDLDKDLYDMPLTIKTIVPDNWFKCMIFQNTNKQTVDKKDGKIIYNVFPETSTIKIIPIQ